MKEHITNVKKLIFYRVSLDAIPKGGGVKDGILFLSSPKLVSKSFKESCEWVNTAISIVRQAKAPNPFKDADNETIAGEILRQIEERRAGLDNRG